jgi:hypothetical protein
MLLIAQTAAIVRTRVENVRIDRHSTPDIVRDTEDGFKILMVAAVGGYVLTPSEHPTSQKQPQTP